jgi:hypothetical protein
MFGGLSFMVGGQSCCAVLKNDLVIRVGSAQFDEVLAGPHVRPFDFNGRPSTGMVYVASTGLASEQALCAWGAAWSRLRQGASKGGEARRVGGTRRCRSECTRAQADGHERPGSPGRLSPAPGSGLPHGLHGARVRRALCVS